MGADLLEIDRHSQFTVEKFYNTGLATNNDTLETTVQKFIYI